MNKPYFLLFLYLLLNTLPVHSQNKNWLYDGIPVFHGAKVTGNYPNTDFIFTVPATGQRPITFTAQNLPKGLLLDPSTGIIKGAVNDTGTYRVKIIASNTQGTSEEELNIIICETLCLTPAMGWNSWNVFTKNIDEKMLLEMADAMINNGMRDLGYQYINIDDFWHADSRDSLGRPVVDKKKFPHGMKYVSDYVHAKGLKLGIYSCAGKMTCGRRFGGYQYEEIDAKAYADWGVDLLKYDYCYAPAPRKAAVERYTKMGTALKHSGRSIVFSVCEWGFRKPWLWAQKAGAQYWRITPDIMDGWKFPSIIFYSTMGIINREEKLGQYAGTGHWNDPDMLTVGNYGKGNATSRGGLYKGMTDAEYQSQFSLWCMFSAPLIASCDLRKMNDATYNILTNPELIAIDQDGLGEQAKPVYKHQGIRVYIKHLEGGAIAVAIFNTSKSEKKFDLKPDVLGLNGAYITRDLWQHIDKGSLNSKMTIAIQAHETVALKLSP